MKRFKSIRHAQLVPVGVQRHLAALWAPSAPAVGGRLPTGEGRPLRGLQRDHRGEDHGRRLNRRLGQDVSSKPRLITPNHHIGQLGWLKLTVPMRGAIRMADHRSAGDRQAASPLRSSRREPTLFGMKACGMASARAWAARHPVQ